MTDEVSIQSDPTEPPPKRTRPVRIGRIALVLALAGVALGLDGVYTRSKNHTTLAQWTNDQAVPTVAMTTLQRDNTAKEVALPGDVEAFYSAAIHGQASGYVQEWRSDIGAQVKKGDILAIVETPELDERLTEAEGELAKAKASQELARVTASRWEALRGTSAVSQQAVDEKESDGHVKDAEVAAAKANLDRLKAMKGFSNIVAPFDGVVTARNVDIGSLVTTASSGAPLFTVADTHKMRIYVRAPERYASTLKTGMTAKLFVPEYPDRIFEAKVNTTSHAIDPKSRTLLVELLADNPEGLLSPGAFAQVRFQLPPDPNSLRAPASALLFRNQSTMIATVDPDKRIHLNKVQITRDYGADVEISGPLQADTPIVSSPPESIADGEEVRIVSENVANRASVPDGVETKVARSGQDRSE